VKPFRLEFIPVPGATYSESVRNVNLASGVSRVKPGQHEHPVAVCGGGPSLDAHLDELRAWPGDIWAINKTADYLLDRGIDCTMFTVDGLVKSTSATKRLIASNCDPALFEGAQCFGLIEYESDGVPGGTTSAGRTPALALRLGYPGVVYFGCDSSFVTRSHVDRNERLDHALIVRADGSDHLTHPELCMQAECLSEVLREFPDVFQSRSGGLLDAMTKDTQWSVVAVSTALKAHLIEHNGDDGIYDAPYVAPCKECGQTQGHYDDCPVGLGVSE
jgi:hypothetical protein